MENNKKIILFDGICNLCNSAVRFVIKRDRNNEFRFATLQGEIGQQLINERNIDTSRVDSIILIEPGVAYYVKSTAALKIGRSFGGFWKIANILYLIREHLILTTRLSCSSRQRNECPIVPIDRCSTLQRRGKRSPDVSGNCRRARSDGARV